MKIEQQKVLFFTEGNSDKVYEVDLCSSGMDLFVVNFRYGRRGSSLREGTKTVFPVSLEEADKIFEALVASKIAKGYYEDGQEVVKGEVVVEPLINADKKATILKYLKAADAGTYTRDWKVSRIIWKAADLHITASSEYLPYFLNSEDEFEQYAAIYGLLKFNDSSQIEQVYAVFTSVGFESKCGRIAASYILKLGNASYKAKLKLALLDKFPNDLKIEISNRDSFLNTLAVYFLQDKSIDAALLYYVYLYSFEDVNMRDSLLRFITKVPLKANTFKSIRYIYRASFELNDITFYALVSKQTAVSAPGYSSNYIYVNNEWTDADDEKQKKNPTIAFSKKTKAYFNKTTYKFVYDISVNNSEKYVDYATKLLVSLDDTVDNCKEDIQYNYIYNSERRNYHTEKRTYPKYHEFSALMFIVYGASTQLNREHNKWFYTGDVNFDALPREELLPEIWNTKPNEVLYILVHAKSEIAIQFALKIIKANREFLDDISDDILKKLVAHYHPKVLELILRVIKSKYNLKQAEPSIVIALLQSKNEKAIDLALNWVNTYERHYFSDSNFIANLLLCETEKVVNYLKSLYADYAKYNVAIQFNQLESLFKNPSVFSFEHLLAINNLIGNTHFGELLNKVLDTDIIELAKSSLVTNKLFAANLAKQNTTSSDILFKDSIDDYIQSDDAQLRHVGIELLSTFPDDFLLKHHKMISGFCFSEYSEVRTAIQPTIERLIILDLNFKNNLFNNLLQIINVEENYEGLHLNCYTLLTDNYSIYLNDISEEQIFSLVLSNYEYAQKIGTPLFITKTNLHSLPMRTIVNFANSAIFDVRKMIQDYFTTHIDRINNELEAALLIYNSTWEDMIIWSCTFFETYITPENWTTNMLLYACDHTKKDVQAFGRKMITQHFTEDKGLPLLLKLQEHPTKDMQFFVTNYLDNYAKDNEAVILKLEHFFKSSLFNINTHRTTKTRIYAFLEAESIKSIAVANMTITLISSVLGTKIKTDTSHNIDVLLSIAEHHPNLEVPLLIKMN
ncbi:WGR domain-containing protein [Lacinutrix undariae]